MTYAEVILRVRPGDEEAAESALLELGALGTSRDCGAPEGQGAGDVLWPETRTAPQPGDPGAEARVEVVGYFTAGAVPDRSSLLACCAGLQAALRPLRDACRSASDEDGAPREAMPEVQVRLCPMRDWAAETRRSFTPFQPLKGLTIAPPWDRPAHVEGALIVLNPAAAFGLGTHATTRGCLALMPPAPRGIAPALDLGTGTGILAIRAAQVGYAPVFGWDIDAVAAAAARENVRGNGLEARVAVAAGTLAAVRAEARFALVLANIFLNPLLALTEDLARRLKADGRLVVSGIFAEDVPAVVERFAGVGLRLDERRSEERWAALRFVHDGTGPLANGTEERPPGNRP